MIVNGISFSSDKKLADRTDDSPSNLEILTKSDHMKLHHRLRRENKNVS